MTKVTSKVTKTVGKGAVEKISLQTTAENPGTMRKQRGAAYI